MSDALSVLMTTEGTYPYGAGGVSTWCDALLRNTPEVRYTRGYAQLFCQQTNPFL